MGTIKIELSEIKTVRIGFESVVSGIGHTDNEKKTFYIVSDEKYEMDNEGGFIGYLLDDEGVGFGCNPVKGVSDYAIYLYKIDEKEVKDLIGEDMLEWHKDRMLAYEALMQTIDTKPHMSYPPKTSEMHDPREFY